MSRTFPFGLIGDELELRKNLVIDINNEGRIEKISSERIKNSIYCDTSNKCILLCPGLFNSHVHIGDSFAKELGNNQSLIDIVAPPNGLKHRLLRETDNDIKINSMISSISYMLSTGTTFFVDFRENGIKGISLIKKALEKSTVNCLILGRPTEEDTIESILKVADGIGFSSYLNVSNLSKKKLGQLKMDYPSKIIACHDAELDKNSEITNQIVKENFIDVIVHGTQYNKGELVKVKDKRIGLVLCPRCNGYFGVGFPPFQDIISINIAISIGTDNIMANSPDLFEELRYFYRIYRVLANERGKSSLSSVELLKMITINAARNFKLENDYGSISEGKFADFFTIDMTSPNLHTYQINSNTIHDLLVQRLVNENIKNVYIRGKSVFERS